MLKFLVIISLFLFSLFSCSKMRMNKIEYTRFQKGNYFGILNSKKDTIIPANFTWIEDKLLFNKGFRGFLNEKNCIIGVDNKFIIDTSLNYNISQINNRFCHASNNSKMGVLNSEFKLTIPLIYDQIGFYFQNGIVKAKKDNSYGFIDTNNNIIIPFDYEYFEEDTFSEGLIPFRSNRKSGYINLKNQIIIPMMYSGGQNFHKGLARVANESGKYGYINKENKLVIPFEYDYLSSREFGKFEENKALTSKNKKMGIINSKNEEIIPHKYSVMGELNNGFYYIEYGKKERKNGRNEYKCFQYGYLDTIGKEFMVENKKYDTINWNINKAPIEIPDASNLLLNENGVKFESNLISFFTIISSNFNQKDFQSKYKYTNSELLYEVKRTDSFYNLMEKRREEFSKNDTSFESDGRIYSSQEIKAINDSINIRNQIKRNSIPKWTIESLMSASLSNLCNAPKKHESIKDLVNICISNGLMINGSNLRYSLVGGSNKDSFEKFKKQTIFKIISDEKLRAITWNWIKPSLKLALNTMHPFHKKAYQAIALDLKRYINHYNYKKTEKYLNSNYAEFAWKDIDGNYSKNRNLHAFVDRLILVHKIITLQDAKKWINLLSDEVISW